MLSLYLVSGFGANDVAQLGYGNHGDRGADYVPASDDDVYVNLGDFPEECPTCDEWCVCSSEVHNGLVNARQQSDPLTVEDEDGLNDGPAGNGLADLSTTSLIGVIGAAIGAVAVVAMVLGIVSAAKRRKRAGMAEETQIAVELGMDKAAVDSVESVTAETVTAEIPSENGTAAAATEGDVAVEVAVEIVATKVDDAVSVQQEQ